MLKSALIKSVLSGLMLAGTLGSASALEAPRHTNITQTPDLYVVMFRAEWCGPCKIVEPKISQALQTLNDKRIEYVTFDITSPGLSEVSAHRAFDRRIVPQYNMWMGVTGFAAIIDGDTKNTLGCINMLYDVPSMTTHIKNLKSFAVSNQKSVDLTCPEPNH